MVILLWETWIGGGECSMVDLCGLSSENCKERAGCEIPPRDGCKAGLKQLVTRKPQSNKKIGATEGWMIAGRDLEGFHLLDIMIIKFNPTERSYSPRNRSKAMLAKHV